MDSFGKPYTDVLFAPYHLYLMYSVRSYNIIYTCIAMNMCAPIAIYAAYTVYSTYTVYMHMYIFVRKGQRFVIYQ